jgi:hypothetical protein
MWTFGHNHPVTTATLAQNLQRLLAQVRQDLIAAGLAASVPRPCEGVARSLPLAHAIPSAAFVDVATDRLGLGWKLFSPTKLAHYGIKPLRPESAEAALGTQDFVFLYCGQVRYPETQVGFLFATTLEAERIDSSEASPFDSGALHKKAIWPDTSESGVAFLARYSLPVPEYREHLACRLHFLFAQPEDYVALNEAPIRPDPICLRPKPPVTVTDPRLWTFEIRVRDEVNLTHPHLVAVFYSARLAGERSVRNFLATQDSTVHLEEFVADDAGDFSTLQRRCLDYLRARGIVS